MDRNLDWWEQDLETEEPDWELLEGGEWMSTCTCDCCITKKFEEIEEVQNKIWELQRNKWSYISMESDFWKREFDFANESIKLLGEKLTTLQREALELQYIKKEKELTARNWTVQQIGINYLKSKGETHKCQY